MDAAGALAELVELSTQVVEVAIVGVGGVEASTAIDPARAEALAETGAALLEAAVGVRAGVAVDRVAVETDAGAVLVIAEGERHIVATTVPEPTVGLVTYDLRTALRRIDESRPVRSRRKATS